MENSESVTMRSELAAASGVSSTRSAQLVRVRGRIQLRQFMYMFRSWIVTTFGPGHRSGRKKPREW